MHRNVCTKTAFSPFPPPPPPPRPLLVLFHLSFVGELEKAEGKVFLSPKLLQAGCLEDTDFVVEKYGPGVTYLPLPSQNITSASSLTRKHGQRNKLQGRKTRKVLENGFTCG